MIDLPDTQTQEEVDSEEQRLERKTPWGRLCSCLEKVASVDLIESLYIFGRSSICNIIADEGFPSCSNISKEHFKILKQEELVYIVDLSKNGTLVNNARLDKNCQTILNTGDVISIGRPCDRVFIIGFDSPEQNYLHPELQRRYFVQGTIGRGACGEVKLALDKRTCGKFAIKKIFIRQSSSNTPHLNNPKTVATEISILTSLSHPFIIHMREVFQSDSDVFLVLDYMKGGELTSKIRGLFRFPEPEVKFIFYQILLGVQYLHAKGITHRDLKPENILLHSNDPYPLVKISDFGLSKIMADVSLMESTCGTMHYVAPEILRPHVKYCKKVDVWSMGVMLFYMLCKKLPFTGATRESLVLQIRRGEIAWDVKQWRILSDACKQLVKQMLTVDPQKRISINDIFGQTWIERDVSTQMKVNELMNGGSGLSEEEPSPKRMRFA